jgi:hypothetical protein
MRRRYASREIVGTLRAWNVSVADGVTRAVREAVVRVRQMGGWELCDVGDVGDGDTGDVRESLVAAI